jgi:signal transduction histidine kinase
MAVIALPRDIADAIIVHAVATAQRGIIVVGILLAAVGVSIAGLTRGGDPALLAVAIGALLVVAALALFLMVRPSIRRGVLYLALGSVMSVIYVVALLRAEAQMTEPGPFLLNRIATALIMIGAIKPSARSGIVWTILGFLTAELSLLVGFLIAQRPPDLGITPVLAAIVVAGAYGAFALGRRRAGRRLPDLDLLQRELQIGESQRELERHAARVVHDTVLADLAIVALRPGPLDDGARQRIERDIEIAAGSTVATAFADAPSTSRSPLADDLLSLVHEFQWSGVTVGVSGSESLEVTLDDPVRDAVLGAVRAALDNVARHAGTDRAELVVGARNGTLSVIIVDDGVGFASTGLADDRLGVSSSIDARIRGVGGTVRVWSGDEGTTIMLTVPALDDGDLP